MEETQQSLTNIPKQAVLVGNTSGHIGNVTPGSDLGSSSSKQQKDGNMMEVGKQIGIQTIQRHTAIAAGKTRLPAPLLLKSQGQRPQLLDPKVSKSKITVNDIMPLNIENTRVAWHDFHTKQYSNVVASLLFELLTMLDQELYGDGELNKGKINHLCELINGIPQTILNFTKRENQQQEEKTGKEKETEPISPYSIDMGYMGAQENLPLSALYQTKQSRKKENLAPPVFSLPPRKKSFHLLYNSPTYHPPGSSSSSTAGSSSSSSPSSSSSSSSSPSSSSSSAALAPSLIARYEIPGTRDLSENEKIILEKLIAKGNISQAIEKIEDILKLETISDNIFNGEMGYESILRLHSDSDNLDTLHINIHLLQHGGDAKVLIKSEEQMRGINGKYR